MHLIEHYFKGNPREFLPHPKGHGYFLRLWGSYNLCTSIFWSIFVSYRRELTLEWWRLDSFSEIHNDTPRNKVYHHHHLVRLVKEWRSKKSKKPLAKKAHRKEWRLCPLPGGPQTNQVSCFACFDFCSTPIALYSTWSLGTLLRRGSGQTKKNFNTQQC